jgi:hypothetical protein
VIRGHFAVATDPIALDVNIPGRDLLFHFAVIVDRPAKHVVLVAPNHRYRIEES